MRKTVLIADDDPDILALVTFKVRQAGYRLLTATDGAAALAAARANHPDLAVLDVSMPRMSGLEVCRTLRAEPATRNVPVLLLTARAQDTDIEAGFDVGATDYVVKPFSPRDLVARIIAILGPAESCDPPLDADAPQDPALPKKAPEDPALP